MGIEGASSLASSCVGQACSRQCASGRPKPVQVECVCLGAAPVHVSAHTHQRVCLFEKHVFEGDDDALQESSGCVVQIVRAGWVGWLVGWYSVGGARQGRRHQAVRRAARWLYAEPAAVCMQRHTSHITNLSTSTDPQSHPSHLRTTSPRPSPPHLRPPHHITFTAKLHPTSTPERNLEKQAFTHPPLNSQPHQPTWKQPCVSLLVMCRR